MSGLVCMFITRELAGCPPAWNHAASLAACGWRVVVLQPGGKKAAPAAPSGVEMIALGLGTRRLPSSRALAFKYAEYVLRASRRARALRADVYVGHDLDGLLPAARAARGRGARLLYQAHELWTERTRVPGLALWRRLEPGLLAQCDHIIVPSPERARYYEERFQLRSPPIVVRNCPPQRAPVPPTEALQAELAEHGIRAEMPIVLYQGGLGEERCIPELVEAAKLLPDPVRTVLVGPVGGGFRAKLPRLLAAAEGRALHMPSRSQEELWPLTCRAQVGVALYRPTSLNNRLCAPNKVFEYLMAGAPVVASAGEAMDSLLTRRGLGVTANPEEPRAIAEAIQAALALGQSAGFKTRAGEAVKAEFNWEAQSAPLLQAYSKMLVSR